MFVCYTNGSQFVTHSNADCTPRSLPHGASGSHLSTRQSARCLAIGLVALCMGVMVGCGGSEPAQSPPATPAPSSEKDDTNDQARAGTAELPAQLTAASPQPAGAGVSDANPAMEVPPAEMGALLKPTTDNPLIGSWLGSATLDSALLQQKLERVSEEERAQLQKMAEIFLTYQVAMDFYSDGQLSMVVQFALEGQEQLVSATGSWKIIQRDEDSAIVELVEQIEGKEPNTSQVRIMIHPDGQQIARPAELDPQLAVCEPMFIFNRIPEDFLQQVDVAGQPPVGSLK